MLHLQISFAALTLLPSLSLAVAPAQIPPNGKGPGFLSDLGNLWPEPTGDWLTSTFCFCHKPEHMKEEWQYEKAHIFQHEYYNYHSNATFMTEHMCLARARTQGDRCVTPNVLGDNRDWHLDDIWTCKKFPRTDDEKMRQETSKRSTRRVKRKTPHMNESPICIWNCDMGPFQPDPANESSHPDHDKVCFSVDTDFYGLATMSVKFNRQRRKMAKPGQMGRVKTAFDEVQGYCEDMCQRTFKMPADMKINDLRADGGSRQYVYTDLDDMCDHCR